MLTAMSMEEDRLRGLTTGADAYIVKPFNMDILRQTIVNLIQRTRTLRLKYEHTDQLEGKTAPKSVKSPDEKLLANIMKAINDHLDDENLTMDLIASEVGLSRVHLNRKMKDLTGQTPHDFIRKVRLKKAAELLASGKMRIFQPHLLLGPLQEVLRCIPKPVLQVENRIDYLGTVTAIYQFLELNLIMVNQFESK